MAALGLPWPHPYPNQTSDTSVPTRVLELLPEDDGWMADDDDARAAFLRTARRQGLEADSFAGEMVALFRGTDQEDAPKKLARTVAGSAEDASVIARKTGRRNLDADAEMRLARQRAERFIHSGSTSSQPTGPDDRSRASRSPTNR